MSRAQAPVYASLSAIWPTRRVHAAEIGDVQSLDSLESRRELRARAHHKRDRIDVLLHRLDDLALCPRPGLVGKIPTTELALSSVELIAASTSAPAGRSLAVSTSTPRLVSASSTACSHPAPRRWRR